MKDCIQIRIGKGLISLNEDRTRIAYVYQKKVRNVIHHMKCVHETAMLYFGGSAASSVYPHPIELRIAIATQGKADVNSQPRL